MAFHDSIDYGEAFTFLQNLVEKSRDANHEVYIAGQPILTGWVYKLQKQTYGIFAITLIALTVALVLYMRNVAGVVTPVVCAAVAGVWGFGFIGWMGYNLDPLVLVVPILISARTASHCVQMMERYYDEIRLGQPREAAVRTSMGELIVPASIGIFTDTAGLMVLAVSSIPMIAKLGYFCAVWSASNILTVGVLVPLVMSLLPMPKLAPVSEGEDLPARTMHAMGRWIITPRATRTIIAAVAPIRAVSSEDWATMIVVPEADFIGFVALHNRSTLVMSGAVALLVALFAALLIRQGLRADRNALLVIAREPQAVERALSA